ncbi:uncharacterized protein LOC120639951 [Panicum virgatum]|uniref:uncharacterized protein LOC120639951 n=1 Tax=Panicum virgatum TaxID=38727 RepID=UPI0019D56A59|nr:uncharacterized protein LOC120639951 [Panicum virgatum]
MAAEFSRCRAGRHGGGGAATAPRGPAQGCAGPPRGGPWRGRVAASSCGCAPVAVEQEARGEMGWGGRGGYGKAHCGLDLTESGRRTEIDERAALRRRSKGGFGGASPDSAGVGLGRVRGGMKDLEREEEEWAHGRGGGRL